MCAEKHSIKSYFNMNMQIFNLRYKNEGEMFLSRKLFYLSLPIAQLQLSF